MLKIRSEQLDRFAKEDARHFRVRLRDFLRGEFVEAREMPVPKLDKFIEGQLCRAPRYSLRTEKQQAVYVTTAFLVGEDFDERFGAARDVLPSALYTGDEKSEWMSQWTQAMVEALTSDT